MNLLAELYNNQQNISQNPTGTIRTPRQIAYDNWLNAQQQAQNTTKDEWGQAIGNSVNGLAKIISSAVVKNPYERAGATRNLDNFDDRQDQLVRDWAMQRMKNRNDFVQQAKEQLGMTTADEEREYAKQQNEIKLAYQKALDEWNQNFKKDEFKYSQDKDKKEFDEDVRRYNQNQKRQEDRDWIADRNADRDYNLKKRNLELAEQQAQQEANANIEQAKARQKQLEGYVSTAEDMFKKGLIDNETLWAIKKNPELAETLVPKSTWLGFTSSKKMELDKNLDNSYEILQDKDGNLAKVYKDGRIEEI